LRYVSLPEFFVIGAPKAGTTAVHVALARHPRLFMSRVKEPAQRSSLRLAGKIGTGYQSIDDPLGDRAAERTRPRRA
jgi:hypothetical protein